MRVLLLAAAVVASSCGPGAAPPSLTVPLGTNDFGGYALLVYDDSGLVSEGRALARPPGRPDTEGIVALPERRELELRWIGGACSHRPTVHISGIAADLSIVLSNPPDQQLLPVSCPAVGILFAVTLLLSEPVAQADVTLEVRH